MISNAKALNYYWLQTIYITRGKWYRTSRTAAGEDYQTVQYCSGFWEGICEKSKVCLDIDLIELYFMIFSTLVVCSAFAMSLWDLQQHFSDNKNAHNALGKLIHCLQVCLNAIVIIYTSDNSNTYRRTITLSWNEINKQIMLLYAYVSVLAHYLGDEQVSYDSAGSSCPNRIKES